jgi:hypothetical protein
MIVCALKSIFLNRKINFLIARSCKLPRICESGGSTAVAEKIFVEAREASFSSVYLG